MGEFLSDNDIYRNGRQYDWHFKEKDDDLNFYLSWMKKLGGSALELACGTGRLLIPAIEQGFDVTGIDISEDMLKQARVKAKEFGINAEIIHADIRNFKLERKFSLIYLPFNSIAHLYTRKDIEQCFQKVRQHLESEGRFIIDYFNPDLSFLVRDIQKRFPVSSFQDEETGARVTINESNEYDRATQINHIKWFKKIGIRNEEINRLTMRIFYPQELDRLIEYNGFEIVDKFGKFDETPFTSDSPTQIIVSKLKL
ncbi:MAG: class I SAM-dependent methyltransferase [Planctomycetes bacterium]|nr:class I SAM-dependent methyltransferase [Planctomycetota bacterium]